VIIIENGLSLLTSGEVAVGVLEVAHQLCDSELLGSFGSLGLPPLRYALLDQLVLLVPNQVSYHLLLPLVLPHSRGQQQCDQFVSLVLLPVRSCQQLLHLSADFLCSHQASDGGEGDDVV